MITLLTYPAAMGVFSPSPFCVKARHLLHLSGQDWQREDLLDPRKMPYAKLPAIRLADGRIIADSGNIQRHLEELGTDFNAGLSARDHAAAHALIRMAEEHLYFIVLLDRWGRDEVWPHIRDTYFTEIPALLRGLISGQLRKKVLSGMKAQGLGRLSFAEQLERAEPDFRTIAALVADQPFLLGEIRCAADISVAVMLEAAATTPVPTPLSKRVTEDAVLMSYLDRFNAAVA